MKILLVAKSKKIEVLGLMYLSAIAKEMGSSCRIVSIDECPTVAMKMKPDMIGYSVMTGDQSIFKTVNSRLKEKLSFVSVFGGPHATFFPEDFMGRDDIDEVVRGEGENWMAEYLGGKGDLTFDTTPLPDRTDFPGMRIRDFIASRGCLSSCGYCYNSAWNKMYPNLKKVRVRDVDSVIFEVISVSPEFAYFQDSCFGIDDVWLKKFCTTYRRTTRIPYHVHMRPSQITEEKALWLANSNCRSIKIALETSSDRLRKLINRGNTNNEDAINASKYLRKWDITLIMQNILGLPTSTIEEDLATLEVNIRCRPRYAWCSIFQPYPGTMLGDKCKKNGWYLGDYSEISDSFFDTSVLEFTPEHKEQIECLQRIFAFSVEMQVLPSVKDLTYRTMPKFIHNAMRRIGDERMFPGVY
jgi:anaerobic magnesium-protoporphyrin IX monomethyl ester cyclase